MSAAVRAARSDDLPEIAALLASADLPELPARPLLANLVVAEVESKVVGVAALDVFGRAGLVRGFVVAPEHRGHGIGRDVFRGLRSRAYELSLRQLCVAAPAAAGFFEKLGFTPIESDGVPLPVRSSRVFAELAATATALLRLPLQ